MIELSLVSDRPNLALYPISGSTDLGWSRRFPLSSHLFSFSSFSSLSLLFPPSHRVCLLVSWMASTRWPGMIITTPCCCNQHNPIPIILIYSHSWCYCNCRITTIPPLSQIHHSHTLLDCCCQIISILINIPSGTLCSWIISLHVVRNSRWPHVTITFT